MVVRRVRNSTTQKKVTYESISGASEIQRYKDTARVTAEKWKRIVETLCSTLCSKVRGLNTERSICSIYSKCNRYQVSTVHFSFVKSNKINSICRLALVYGYRRDMCDE